MNSQVQSTLEYPPSSKLLRIIVVKFFCLLGKDEWRYKLHTHNQNSKRNSNFDSKGNRVCRISTSKGIREKHYFFHPLSIHKFSNSSNDCPVPINTYFYFRLSILPFYDILPNLMLQHN